MGTMEQKPRKVRIASVVFDTYQAYLGLDYRKEQVEALVQSARSQARIQYGESRLDLIVLTEDIMGSKSDSVSEAAWDYGTDLEAWAGNLARSASAYVVLCTLRVVDSARGDFRNSAFLIDRAGKTVGVYDKIHPVLDGPNDDSRATTFEGGVTPGSAVPVFECDFGRLGIQICFDMDFDDGWDLLARKGAEIVVWPTESPQRIRPAWRALAGDIYIVSATSRISAAVFSPIGLVSASVQGPAGVVVDEIDLSYARLNYSDGLRGGQAVGDRFGEAVGYVYSPSEDMGLFWSNDPDRSIGSMLSEIGLDEDLHRMTVRNHAALAPYRPLV